MLVPKAGKRGKMQQKGVAGKKMRERFPRCFAFALFDAGPPRVFLKFGTKGCSPEKKQQGGKGIGVRRGFGR